MKHHKFNMKRKKPEISVRALKAVGFSEKDAEILNSIFLDVQKEVETGEATYKDLERMKSILKLI